MQIPNSQQSTIGWRQRLARLQGSPVAFDLRAYDQELTEITRLGKDVEPLSDGEIEARAGELRERAGGSLESIRAAFFALARDASRRVLGLRPFDVQVLAAIALDCGHLVEMQTGEGKTLAAVMPAALRALTGQGAHVLTFNDYLARRDAEWMGPVYAMLGLSVGCVQQGMTPEERRRAYLADVTYVTAKEAGFDHLRDLLAMDRQALVHRPFHFALVDEADSLLIALRPGAAAPRDFADSSVDQPARQKTDAPGCPTNDDRDSGRPAAWGQSSARRHRGGCQTVVSVGCCLRSWT